MVPHPIAKGKNLRARVFRESVYRVTNELNLTGEDDDVDDSHHATWGRTMPSMLRQYQKGADQNMNQIELTVKYIALPGVCSSNPRQVRLFGGAFLFS